jgi:serine/threonine-protein kinase
VVELQPASFLGHLLLGTVYRGQSKYPEAITAAQSAIQISSRHPWAVVDLGLTYAAAGRMADAKTIYDELVQRARTEYVQGSILAPLAAAVGKTDKAFALLEESYQERDARLAFIGVWPDYDPLREDPRFGDLMKRMGLG